MQKRYAHVLIYTLVALLVLSCGGTSPTPTPTAAQNSDFCGDPATPIHDIQGTGDRTPLGGQKVTVEAVVVGDYQDTITELGGFFIQEEDADADDNPLTSEGVFVDSSMMHVDVHVGDVVRITGTAFELSDSGVTLTQIRRLDRLVICQSDAGADVTPASVTLPLESPDAWERYEGMLVTFTEPLTVTQLYNLGRYGEVMLAEGGRLYQPTNVARPGPEAQAIAEENARRAITLDDAISLQNPDPIRWPSGGLSLDNLLRSGYTVEGLTAVLDQRYGTYRLQPVSDPTFLPTAPRPDVPDVGGRLRVVSFNVKNFFNGDGQGGGFPTPRGADTFEELQRQRAKLVAALVAMDADVIGLVEIENDGDGPNSAIAELTDALNEALGEDVYAYVPDPDGQPLPDEGGDAIKQAIIYRTSTVQPVGEPVTTLAPPFDQRRPPITQSFQEIATGEVFTVSVNHFKSKGCRGAGVDPDTGDGQGCWNNERTQAAHTLIDWLATDPTGVGDPDVLVLGDLNAYAMEDPLMAFADAGYVNLAFAFGEADDYSYTYYGQVGLLDYTLASPSLAPQVTGAEVWHINADEPRILDYDMDYKSEGQIEGLYAPDPFRSSDHDPALAGLALGAAE